MMETVLMLNYLLYGVHPPTPFAEEWVPVCLEACALYRDGDFEAAVRLPEQIINTRNGTPYTDARDVVKTFGLERTTFVW